MSEAEQTGREEIWLEKYRPEQLADVLGQEAIVERLQSYVDQDDLNHLLFSGPAGVGKCATGETPVLTSNGLRQIEDIVGDHDGFERNTSGLEVLTYTDAGEFEYTEPSHRFGKQADNVLRVETRDGTDLTVTPEHKLLVLTHEGFEWREAADLRTGDRVVRPLEAPLPDEDPTLDWMANMDGDRTLVHLSSEFSDRHDIPFEENLVGIKKRALRELKAGRSVDTIAADLGTTEKTVRAARYEFDDDEIQSTSRVCSLSYLRSLEIDREVLREHVEAVQYVSTTNKRSRPVKPQWELTPDLARFLGLAVSEARIEAGRIKFYNTDETLLSQFERTASDLFGLAPESGEQNGVPYRELRSKTLTHYLEACFDVFNGPTSEGAIGSALLQGDEQSRRAFLQAVFDSEAHISEHGTIELTQKDDSVITLLSYLLAGFGVPSRRKTEQKRATNGSDTYRTYDTLYISNAAHLQTFETEVGFSIEQKATRLREAVARPYNPNDDTIPTQAAVTSLCERLNLTKSDYIPDSLDPESPGRARYVRGLSTLLEDATARLEAVQEAREQLTRLEPVVDEIAAVPAQWVGQRTQLEPLETRRPLSESTAIETSRLLEYARGDRTPYADRVQMLLADIDGCDRPDLSAVQSELKDVIESTGVSYSAIAASTSMYTTDVGNLLDNDGLELSSLPRFRTVVERLDEELSRMASLETLDDIQTLHRLVESDIYLDEIETVEPVSESRRVYDLTVPGTHNYVAGDVPSVMHNTTSAVAIARELYGDDWQEHFLELNASDERGIDVVRDRIKSFARTSFGGANYRIIFLDEADALCVPPGTEVVTGYPSSPELKPIEEVESDGEPIPSVDFETNEIQSDKGKLVDSGVADFFEVELEDGRSITASLTHPFFVVGDDGRLVEKELRELDPGDKVADFKEDIGVSRCDICGDWTAGRFCSVDCKDEGHSREMQCQNNPMYGTEWSDERREKIVEKLSDGGLKRVETTKIRQIEYSYRGKAYNISMEGTPNFMLGNGILTHNTSDAQGALRRTMEQFSNNVRFILSCNYSSQIIDPIQSRCTVFRFSPLSDEAIAEQVREIADSEGIEITDDGVDALVYVAGGDMRAAVNGLQAAAVTDGPVDEEAVFEITSTARPEDIEEMVTLALDGDFTAARTQLDRLLTEEGIAGGDVIDQLHRSVWEFDLGDEAAVRVLDRIGEADYRITEGANERIQLEALLASLALEE